MKLLAHGARCSEIKVSPANWKSTKADVSKNWRIHYRFYSGSQVKQIQIYGMNEYKTLKDRQKISQQLIDQEYDLLLKHGYNPIKKEVVINPDINPHTPFITALNYALKKVSGVHNTILDIQCVIRGTEKAAKILNLDEMEISMVTRKHIKSILEQCSKTNPKWSARRHNMYRAYLMKLFKELVEVEATEHNPVREVAKQKQLRKIRRVITMDELVRVTEHLATASPRFNLFIHIFFHSGARRTELFNLKVKDVDMVNQKFRTVIRKGREYREVDRTINNNAVSFWTQAIGKAKPEQYIFSEGLVPGVKSIRPDQIHRRWKRYVKKDLGISADFNTIRHLALDAITEKLSMKAAAGQAGHTTTEMVAKVYAINEKARQHLQMKELNISIS